MAPLLSCSYGGTSPRSPDHAGDPECQTPWLWAEKSFNAFGNPERHMLNSWQNDQRHALSKYHGHHTLRFQSERRCVVQPVFSVFFQHLRQNVRKPKNLPDLEAASLMLGPDNCLHSTEYLGHPPKKKKGPSAQYIEVLDSKQTYLQS
jgi:hypothetical protein